jgi:hypothetical protein
LEEQAPKTCKAVLNVLPLKGEVDHATWSGDMVFLKGKEVPFKESENRTVYPSRGDVVWNSDLKEVQIIYGQVHLRVRYGPSPSNVFARITENLEELRKVGSKVHKEGSKKITIEPHL